MSGAQPARHAVTLEINGERRRVLSGRDESLLQVLRGQLGLTGSKPACGEGACGACTVWIDGVPARSCVIPVSAVAGRRVTTIEGLAPESRLHPVQEAFLRAQAIQCGYCTPGMVMAAAGLLATNPSPTAAEIVQTMRGNICRCGAYPRIVAAVREAARMLTGGHHE